MSWDPYLDLDTGALRNRLKLTTPETLQRAEAGFTALRIAELSESPLPGHYDLDHLRAFHWHIFGDVYDWAGQLRTVRLGKGGRLFTLPEDLVDTANQIFDQLATKRYLQGLPREAFVDGLATLFARINELHPFREGNGRTLRTYLAQLARDAGYQLSWSRMDPATNVTASQRARDGDHGPLRAMLDDLVERPARPSTPPPRDASP